MYHEYFHTQVLHVQYFKGDSIGKGISEGGASSSTYLDLWTVDAGVRTVEVLKYETQINIFL